MAKRKSKENELMDRAKESIKLGVTSQAGMIAVGSLGSLGGTQTSGITKTVGAGLNLVNVGQLVKNTKSITKMF